MNTSDKEQSVEQGTYNLEKGNENNVWGLISASNALGTVISSQGFTTNAKVDGNGINLKSTDDPVSYLTFKITSGMTLAFTNTSGASKKGIILFVFFRQKNALRIFLRAKMSIKGKRLFLMKN